MKISARLYHTPLKTLSCCIWLFCAQLNAQDSTFYDQAYTQLKSRVGAKYMEIKKCAADNPVKCSVTTFSLDSNRVLSNWRYIDFENGTLHGRCSRWHNNGALLMDIIYENGQKQGVQKVFYSNGQLKREIKWDKDTVVAGAFFNPDGSAKTTVFKDDMGDTECQTEPKFGNGPEDLYRYLVEHTTYPEAAKEEGQSGTVILTFVVGKKGEILDIEVKKSPHPSLSNALIQTLRSMPPWQPGLADGRPVKVRYTLPFRFVIE